MVVLLGSWVIVVQQSHDVSHVSFIVITFVLQTMCFMQFS